MVHGHVWVEENRPRQYFMLAVLLCIVGGAVALFSGGPRSPGGVSVAMFDVLAVPAGLLIAVVVVIWRRYLRMHTAIAASPDAGWRRIACADYDHQWFWYARGAGVPLAMVQAVVARKWGVVRVNNRRLRWALELRWPGEAVAIVFAADEPRDGWGTSGTPPRALLACVATLGQWGFATQRTT